MDTSQAHLSSKGSAKDSTKTDSLSKDELHAVLKYGAQKMWVVIDACLFLVALIHHSSSSASQLRQR